MYQQHYALIFLRNGKNMKQAKIKIAIKNIWQMTKKCLLLKNELYKPRRRKKCIIGM